MLIKASGPSIGTPEIDFSTLVVGPVYAIYTVDNAGISVRHCARFERDHCFLGVLGGGEYVFSCEEGVADSSCGDP